MDYVYGEAKRRYEEKILSYLYKYRKGDLITDLSGKNVMIVDEGADTGLTLMAALKTVMSLHAHKVGVAIPVVPESLDEEFFAHRVPNFVETKLYYRHLPRFSPIEKREIEVCDLDDRPN